MPSLGAKELAVATGRVLAILAYVMMVFRVQTVAKLYLSVCIAVAVMGDANMEHAYATWATVGLHVSLLFMRALHAQTAALERATVCKAHATVPMAIAANLANPDLLQSARFIVQVMEDARRRVVTAMQGGQGQHVTNLTCKLVHVSRWLTALGTVYVQMAVVSATMALLETIARCCSRSKAAVIIVRVSGNVALLFWKLEASLVSGEILHLLLAFVLALTTE